MATTKTYQLGTRIPDGTLEALKWLALACMTLDHINKYLLDTSLPWMFWLGRMAMPLFAYVYAYNLARPQALERGIYTRSIKRLVIYGAIAAPVHIALGGLAWGWWPVNILFMLASSAGVLYLVDQGGAMNKALALGLFLAGGAMVEFWWPAIAYIVMAHRFARHGDSTSMVTMGVCLVLLTAVNQNLWALAALPIIILAPKVDLAVPRLKNVFYVFYPAHLAMIWLARELIGG